MFGSHHLQLIFKIYIDTVFKEALFSFKGYTGVQVFRNGVVLNSGF